VLDAAMIARCSDPSLDPALVRRFVTSVGSGNPLAVTVTENGQRILIPTPSTADEAMRVVRDYVGSAAVRVGVTQFPAGIGGKNISRLSDGLVDPCENLTVGTKMFAKILRIVSKWYGNPTSADAAPEILEDALDAWSSGYFEGTEVFEAEDIGPASTRRQSNLVEAAKTPTGNQVTGRALRGSSAQDDSTDADMRIDLSRLSLRATAHGDGKL
jgi:hypothetical protein